MHIGDGNLRAYADGGLPTEEAKQAAAHLASCAACRARLEDMNARAHELGARLSALSFRGETPDARAALNRLRRRELAEQEKPMINQIFSRRFRTLWIGAAAVLLAAVAFSFAPVQAWAGQFLSLFRVQQVTVLPIDTTGLSQMTGNTALAQQVSQMMSKSVTVTKQPGNPQVVDSAASASKLAGFQVRLPASRSDKPQLTVLGGTDFTAVADRTKAQAILDEVGRSDLVLPQSLDGATFKVSIPSSVNAGYGSCPAIQAPGELEGSQGRQTQNCIMFVQMPSPTVDTPPNVDIQQLAQIGLQFTGMTAQQAQDYSNTVDWTSTLVIPVPRNGSTYQQENVDGVTGYLIQRPVDDVPGYMLVWVKNGIVYAISGQNNNVDAALKMANSLK